MSEFDVQNVTKSIPIFSTIIPDYIEINKELKKIILEHRENYIPDLGSDKSNVKAWHSSWGTHNENPKFMPFVELVTGAVEFISQQYFNTKSLTYNAINMWAMMYEESEYTKKHSHFPSEFSCVYYVDVEEGSSPIIFEDSHTIEPKNGMLVIWQGLLQHSVPPTKGKRMAISMNFNAVKDVLINN